eukprot:TRINITY_DN1520_c0_g1_i1.p1 TRINITY_DN1520_c0_g1~~TRINITY_DN1520_c0_g1_i1.p1  ORF type:complete len:297 (+),score=76.99 TRINITY_DN1520_c0_g1_i1:229-1119(+)
MSFFSKSPPSSPAGDKERTKKPNVEVTKWLKSVGLENYAEAFDRENIDLRTLPDIDDDHLKELGMPIGDRIKLKKAIDLLKQDEADDSPVEYVSKVIVVGDIGTGKTSLIQRYTNGTFDRGYKATIGVDFCLKEIQWNRSTTVSVQLWDIAGQERFANLTRMYYKEARGAFVVFDVSREKTFDAVLKWKADIDSKVTLPDGRVIPVVLLANKCDLIDKKVDLDQFCETHGFQKWFLTSAKDDIGINDAARSLVQMILENDDGYVKTHHGEDKGESISLVHHAKPNQKSSGFSCCQN